MSNPQFKSPYRDNITHEKVLDLSCVNEQNKRANWQIRYTGNKVRLTVWTGIEGDKDGGQMKIVLEPSAFYSFLSLMETVISNQEKEVARHMTIKSLGPEGWKKGPIPRGDLYCGRDRDGVVFVSFVQNNRPKLMFPLQEDAFYLFCDKGGNPFNKQEASNIVAKAYVHMARNIISSLAATEYVDKESRPSGNKGNKSNYQNNQNQNNYNQNNQNQSQSTQSNDSDFTPSSGDDFDF